jgi:hypothetical protein
MSRALRIFLTCLLALALPLQGYAAQRMLFCAPASHHPVQVPTQQARHDHSAHAHHHSKADAKAPVHDSVHGAKASPGKCSACASCCAAVAIISSPLVFSTSPPSTDYTATVVPRYSGHTPGRLDRPPRSTLA